MDADRYQVHEEHRDDSSRESPDSPFPRGAGRSQALPPQASQGGAASQRQGAARGLRIAGDTVRGEAESLTGGLSVIPRMVKPCTKCGIIRPLTEFHLDCHSADSHKAVCIDCRNAAEADRRERIRQQEIAPRRRWWRRRRVRS
jgi:hypothetical protein